jgi:hypothetical protein
VGPPAHVLKELQQIHPWVRVGWIGEDKKGPDDELNRGSFYLIQLVKRKVAEHEYNEPWDSKGPIYGEPYDRLARIPFMAAGPIDVEDMFSGAVTKALRVMMTPVTERMVKSAQAKTNQIHDEIHDVAGEMGERIYWDAHRTDATSNRALTKEDVTEEDKAILRGERMTDLSSAFMPNMPK